jgi:hypothetical protein
MYGAIYGGVAIGTAGALLWGSTGLSDEDTMYLKEEALRLSSTRDMNNELAQALQQQLPGEMLRPAVEADVQAIPVIEKINFFKTDNDLVFIKVEGGLTFAAGTGDEVTRHGHLGFSARTEKMPIDDWLDTSGQAIGEAMDECLDKIARKMANLILERRSS